MAHESDLTLPFDLVTSMVETIEGCAARCQATLDRISPDLDAVRVRLLDIFPGLIRPVPPAAPIAIGAVDGSHYAVETLGTAFAGVCAIRVDPDGRPDHRLLAENLPHYPELDLALAGLRTIFEITLLRGATPDCLLLLDGSYWSALQAINRMLDLCDSTRGRTDLWAPLLPHLEPFFRDGVLEEMLLRGCVVANSKQTVSRRFVSAVYGAPAADGSGIPATNDRWLFSVVLQPGEYTAPLRLMEDTDTRVGGGAWYAREPGQLGWTRRQRDEIDRAYEDLYVVYYRPHDWGNALRLELPGWLAADDALPGVLTGLRDQIVSPDVQEPRTQFIADVLCKQLPAMLDAIATGTINAIIPRYDPELVHRFFGPYRT
ncbi:MAG TPA: DNA double-strand break repair nuclease NurA [Chloroflexia bacterium]